MTDSVKVPVRRAFVMASNLHHTVRQHGFCHLHESADVRTGHVVHKTPRLAAVPYARFVDVAHDPPEPVVHLLPTPRYTHAVLRLLEARDSHTARIRRLRRAE